MLRLFWSVLRPCWRTETGIFLGIWLCLMICGRSLLLRDPGAFWHPVVGQYMLDHGELIRTDPLSFTRQGQPWTAQQWLAECGMAAVHGVAGFDGLLLVAVTLLAGIYTWVASRLLRGGLHPLPTLVVLALVLLGSSPQFHLRPLILSIGLFGATLALLVDIEAGRVPKRSLWVFPAIVIFWANVHGGVLAGIATVGLCVAGWCGVWLFGLGDSPVKSRRDVLSILVLMSASCLAVLVSPYGLELPRAWLNTLAIPLPQLLQEHAPVDLTSPVGLGVVALGVGYLLLLAGAMPRRPRITWLLPLVWFILACQRVRNVPLFALTAAIAGSDLLPYTRWAAWLQGRDMFLPRRAESSAPGRRWRPAAMRPALLPAILVLAAVCLQAAGIRAPVVGRGWARLDATLWPVDLLPELRRIDRENAENTPIFNDLNLGGFLIYYAPRLRVFIDDRCDLYGGEMLWAYERARREDPAEIDRWQRQYGFQYALVATGKKFDRRLQTSPEWSIVKRTPPATLYRRRGGQLGS